MAPTQTPGQAPGRTTKEPKYSRFTQQELPACKPLLTPPLVITVFSIAGVIFVPIGAVVEVVQNYDYLCVQGSNNAEREDFLQRMEGAGTNCSITLIPPVRMKAPILIYYQLENYFQNHRRYVKSRDDLQLQGQATTNLDSCEPQAYLGGDKTKPIRPCGLVSWSYFNDTYSVLGDGIPIPVNEKGINWKADVKKKFGDVLPTNFNTEPASRGGGTIVGTLDEDEHYIVWMRTAAMPFFRKLWGRIEQDIPAGTEITVEIQNRYNTYRFDGRKAIVLSTMSWLGGKNDFLGIAYLTVGSGSLLFAMLFFVLQWQFARQMGDVNHLSWNKRPNPSPQ